MSVNRYVVCALALAVVAPACGTDGGGAPDAAASGDGGTGYPPPRDDLVPPLGTATAFDLGAWNIENFPKGVSTVSFVADLMQSIQLDLIAVEEIADADAFEELVARLPEYEGVLSTHTYGDGSYQKIGFVYRAPLVSVGEPTLLFTELGYDFPRPPLEVEVTVDDGVHPALELTVIAVHLKAGVAAEDRSRREAAMVALEDHVAALVAGGRDQVVILGDFNEILTSSAGRATMDPWLAAPDDYRVQTDALAQAGEFSFLPSEVVLDHVVTTAGLDVELAGRAAAIPRLDQETFNYESAVSDHLPVVIGIPVLE